MKSTVAPEKMFGILSVISLIRCVLDQTIIYGFGNPYNNMMSQLHMYMYMFILYLCIPAFALFFLGVRKGEKLEQVRQLYSSSVWIWLIIYPAVPIVSYIFNTPYRAHYEWMKYIPTFMTEDNYFPAGMVFVIPIIFYHYVRGIMSIFNFSFFKTLIAISTANFSLYVLFYQYLLRFGYMLWHKFNFECFIGIYGILSIIVALFGLFYFTQYFEEQKKAWTKYFVFKTFIFVLISIFGFVKIAYGIKFP